MRLMINISSSAAATTSDRLQLIAAGGCKSALEWRRSRAGRDPRVYGETVERLFQLSAR